ncbi:MAG: phosphotransferase [Pseudomonadota bacterium]
MINATATRALGFWGLAGADCELIAQRENIVFRVTDSEGWRFALRLHRPGYQSVSMLRSELAWIGHLRANGLNVPAAVPTQTGADMVEVDGYQTDLLTWLDGAPLGATGTPLAVADREGTFRGVGALLAKVHAISDAWKVPADFERQRWDIDGLLGDEPLWGKFWENPGLSPYQRDQLLAARDRLRSDLEDKATDIGLIHADMLGENVIIDGDALGLIDFDDSGFGYRLFDVATALFKNRSEPDYTALQSAFLQGYRQVCPLDTEFLEHFMLVRSLSYVGWIIPRMEEPGAYARQKRFLSSSLPMVEAYLAQTEP